MNYIINITDKYATLPIYTYAMIERITSKAPKHTGVVLYYLIGLAQIENRYNQTNNPKPIETSIRNIAKDLLKQQTSVFRSVKWLTDNGWLVINKEQKNSPKYKLSIEKVNKLLI